jgi:hypothetical protein
MKTHISAMVLGTTSTICGAVLAFNNNTSWGWFFGAGIIIVLGAMGLESKNIDNGK